MSGYEDGYASASIPSMAQRTEISIEDRKAFLLKDIEDARKSIKDFEKSKQDFKSGIDAANNIINIATVWIKEYDILLEIKSEENNDEI